MDSIYGFPDSETLVGTEGDDHIFGYAGNDKLFGLGGNDILEGGEGNDRIEGGGGNNELIGGSGDDVLFSTSDFDKLTGGSGDDTYIVGKHFYIDDFSGLNDTIQVSVDYVKVSNLFIENVIYIDGAKPLPYWIDSFLLANAAAFGPIFNPAKTFYFGFPEKAPTYLDNSGIDKSNWEKFSVEQRIVTREILSHISDYIDLEAVETLNIEKPATFSFQNNNQTSIGAVGYAEGPSLETLRGSDVFIDNGRTGLVLPTLGTEELNLFIHETLHGFGLKHPGYGPDPILSDIELGFEFTRMMLLNEMDQISIGILDVAALQYLYGVNKNARASNDTYLINELEANFIWDGDGTDEIDGSRLSAGATVYLTAGLHGFVGPIVNDFITATGQITINFGTKIENLTGSNFTDQLYGNELQNIIIGKAGNDFIDGKADDDIIAGGLGDDKLTGGAGSDTFRYSKGDGNDTILDFNSAVDRLEYSGFSELEKSTFIESVTESGRLTITLSDGSYLTLEAAKSLTIDSTYVTRLGLKISDANIIMSDGTNSSSYKSTADGTASGTLAIGSNATILANLAYSSSTKAVSSQDALDALKLSVGLSTSGGTKDAFDFMSADFNQDGKVSSQDALSILKYSVGLPTSEKAKWVFVDTSGDYSGVSKSNTSYTEGVSIADLSADTSISLTGILIGDVNDSYSGLIA